jgi:hypothetical protein
MSVDPYERSRFRGEPINLYLFRYGTTPGSYYAYTDAEQQTTDPLTGIVYKPIPIDRGAVTASGNLDKATISINVPRDSEISELFRIYPPTQVVSIVIKQGHIDDPEEQYLVVWSGRVISRDVTDNETTLTCEPIATALRRPRLRRNYQLGCPHVLYGPQCKASRPAATVTTTVEAASGNEVTLPSDWNGAEPLANYIGGLAEWNFDGNVELRTILRVKDEQILVLSGPVRFLAEDDPIKVSKGCSHNMDGCNTHSNILNYGGQPWIPTKNPIGTTSTFN